MGIIGFGRMGSTLGCEFGVATGGLVRVAAVVEPDDDKFSEGCKSLGNAPERCNSIAALLDLGLDPTTLRDSLLSEIIDIAQHYAHRCDESRILSTSQWVRPRPAQSQAVAS